MRNCDECRFGEIKELKRGKTVLLCAHNHTPPFVVPGWEQIQTGEWGWMRRCRDFDATQILDPKPDKEPERKIYPPLTVLR